MTYEQTFTADSSGTIVTDKTGNIIFVNEQAKIILKTHKALIVGSFISDILPCLGSLALECLKTGKSQTYPQIITELDRNLILNITPIQQEGKVLGVACSFQEIQQFELSVQQSEFYKMLKAQLDTVINASSEGILVYNSDGRVISANETLMTKDGFDRNNVIGVHWSDLIKMGFMEYSVMPEVLKTKKTVSFMTILKKTNQPRLITGTPALDQDGNVKLVVVHTRDMGQFDAIKEKVEDSLIATKKFKTDLTEEGLLELRDAGIITASEAMKQVFRMALKISCIEETNVLILGESGTGKGVLARFIHNKSKRKSMPYISINCAAIPHNLLESEFYGYEKGAFTGALGDGKVGLFELAHEGTLFLDEIGDLPMSIQAKLLKYLDDHEIMRLGGTKSKKVDCTIIAATNCDLEKLVSAGQFRKDLFYRLNTFTIRIPPLRERPEDLITLIEHFLRKDNALYGQNAIMTPDALKRLLSYSFPGNVRELKSIIKNAVIMGGECIPNTTTSKSPEENLVVGRGQLNLKEQLLTLEREVLTKALIQYKTTRATAKHLHINQSTLVRKLKKHKLSFHVAAQDN